VPAFIFPESAARALAALVRHGEIARRAPRRVPEVAADRARARAILDAALARGDRKLSEEEALALVAAYGIPTVGGAIARSADEAVRLAESAGYPVVLKIVSPDVVHKSDVDGVRLALSSPDAVRAAYESIVARVRAARPDARVDGVLVQRTVAGGRELIAGVSRAPEFGALVMVGLGGVFVEVLRDVAFRLAPLDATDAREMLQELRGARLLGAVRGAPAVDPAKVADVLVRVSALATDLPDVVELDLNPLILEGDGVVAVDARVLLRE
jgi:acetate---CoA ligase (ADP-forming)